MVQKDFLNRWISSNFEIGLNNLVYVGGFHISLIKGKLYIWSTREISYIILVNHGNNQLYHSNKKRYKKWLQELNWLKMIFLFGI